MASDSVDSENDYLLKDSWSPRYGSTGSQSRFRSRSPNIMWSGNLSIRRFNERLPDRFDGSLPWIDYWAHFEACWELNDWTDQEAALVLAASLSKKACKVLSPKPKDSRGRQRNLSIDELKARLERRYGPGELPESYLAKLNSKRQGLNESLQELGAFVREHATQAYPDADDSFRERMEIIHFRDAVAEVEIRNALFRTRPISLDAAVRIAMETESFMQIEAQRETPRHARTVKKIATNVHGRLDKLEKQQEELMILLTSVVEAQKSQSRPKRSHASSRQCFNCREIGHIKRKCPYLYHCYQKPPRSHVSHIKVKSGCTASQDLQEDQVCYIDPVLHAKEVLEQCEEDLQSLSDQVAVTAIDSCLDEVVLHQTQEETVETGTSSELMHAVSVTEPVLVEEVDTPSMDRCITESSEVKPINSSDNKPCGDETNTCVQDDDVWNEDANGDAVSHKGESIDLEGQDLDLWNTGDWCGLEREWRSFTLIGYWCTYFEFTVYQAGVWCIMWPVYEISK